MNKKLSGKDKLYEFLKSIINFFYIVFIKYNLKYIIYICISMVIFYPKSSFANENLYGCWKSEAEIKFINKYKNNRTFKKATILCFKIKKIIDSYSFGYSEYIESHNNLFKCAGKGKIFIIDQYCNINLSKKHMYIGGCSYEGTYVKVHRRHM